MDDNKSASGPLARALDILNFVASHQKALSIAEISAGLELPLPTPHRLVGNLESFGYLQRAAGSKRIVVGRALMELGANSIAATFRRSSKYAVLQKVSERIGEQCEIGIVRNGYVEYIANVKAESFVGLQFDAGKQVPLHCTSTGKLYMSTLRDAALKKLVMALPLRKFTDNTITDPDELIAEVKRIRAQGWAKSNEEFVKGVVGCSVPILSPKGALVASLGVSAPVARIPYHELDAIIEQMKEAAVELTAHVLNPDE